MICLDVTYIMSLKGHQKYYFFLMGFTEEARADEREGEAGKVPLGGSARDGFRGERVRRGEANCTSSTASTAA